ncbi:MAG: shikimate kinase [Planctomycetota bacterium]
MSKRRSIILLGYRGSGKSTVGRVLAERLELPFVDTDALVVERFSGRSIADIWSVEGEAVFRDVEAQVVTDAVGLYGTVVALGGGAVTEHPAGRSAAEHADALRVYLAAPAEVLATRITGDPNTDEARPSLTGIADVTDEIADVLARRDPVYRAVADVVIEVAGKAVVDIVDQIVACHNDQS